MRRAALIACFVLVSTSLTQAKVATPGLSGGGSLPLTDVLEVTKPYPNLTLQIRLQLVRANLKREQVTCSGDRFGTQWTSLGGARLAPYACPIGKRSLLISAKQTYFDKNGRKVKPEDPELMRKAAKVKEAGLTWKWK